MKRGIDKLLGRRGAVLIIVLWVVVLLSVILTNFAFSVRTHARIASNYAVDNDLHNIACAGIEMAVAALHGDTEPVDSLMEFWSHDEDLFREHAIGGGAFTLIRHVDVGERVEPRYGIEDEASKLNLRTATREQLQRLGGLTEEMISALLDWQDEDHVPQNFGAEREHYTALPKPYPPRNAALLTVEELLLVAGIGAQELYGEDWNRNGVLDPNESDGNETPPPDDGDAILDRGIFPYVTVYSTDKNVTLLGNERVNINEADEEGLKKEIPGLTDEEAKAIVAHRQDKRFEKIGELLNVEELAPQDQQGGQQQGGQQQQQQPGGQQQNGTGGEKGQDEGNKEEGGRDQQGQQQNAGGSSGQQADAQKPKTTGRKIITPERFKQIADYCKVGGDETAAGRVNINTAPARVLHTLPGVTKEMAEAIVSARTEQKKTFRSIGDLLDVPGMTNEVFIPLSEMLTVRSWQFRVTSEARREDTRARKQIVAVLDRSATEVKITYWHER